MRCTSNFLHEVFCGFPVSPTFSANPLVLAYMLASRLDQVGIRTRHPTLHVNLLLEEQRYYGALISSEGGHIVVRQAEDLPMYWASAE